MEPEVSLDDINTSAHHEEAAEEDNAFNAEWQSTDTAHLQPANLPIARVQHAWERKPHSPLTRRRVRVGKVWKRTALMPVALQTAMEDSQSAEGEAGRGVKRRRARNSLQSPLKPVKKLCMDSNFGMGARVSQWDGRGSPVRKIVTRSAVVDELVALPDEEVEDVQEDEDATFEILDEEGNVLAVEEDEDVARDWLDVEEPQHDVADAPYDDTMMHLGDAIRHAGRLQVVAGESDGLEEQALPKHDPGMDDTVAETAPDAEQNARMTSHDRDGVNGALAATTSTEEPATHTTQPPALKAHQNAVLPEGFVSPVRQRRKLGPRSSRAVAAARRQTIPAQFAPAALAPQAVIDSGEDEAQMAVEHELTVVMAEPEEEVTKEAAPPTATLDTTEMEDYTTEEAEWEDVEDEAPEVDTGYVESAEAEARDQSHAAEDDAMAVEPESTDNELGAPSPSHSEANVGEANDTCSDVVDRLPPSPIPTIEGPHPRLPLRRSPRRKSSSPLKQSTAMPSAEIPHLVAFTPIKRPVLSRLQAFQTTEQDAATDERSSEAEDMNIEPVSPILRASSAPPEEPQMSPRKPIKPRVSDDTALLQAFLNRAAESKSSKIVSASERESMTNRRDSDTVRQALASPAKPDVLMDLDPNSPSPRKQSSASLELITTDAANLNASTTSLDQEDAIQDETDTAPKARRSGRGRKKPQVLSQSVYSAPSRITIRGPANANVVDAKKTEAQELAQVTKNNTRKNKGGSVLPNLRLTKMAIEKAGGSEEGGMAEVQETDEMVGVVEGRRGITWAEALVSFYQGGAEPESSLLGDEPEERMPWERSAMAEDEEEEAAREKEAKEKEKEAVAAPPAPADTPSKPKLRRLKPPRTAAAPAKAPAPEPARTKAEETAEQSAAASSAAPQTQPKLVPKPRRSRIATPAKGLTNASLLPADIAPAAAAVATPAEKKPAPRKKLLSKLPAPSVSLGTGKENVLASPAKRKPASGGLAKTLPSAKTFAPKLDFGSKVNLEPTAASGGEGEGMPGLASPAKKGAGRRAAAGVFGDGATAVGAVGAGGEEGGGKAEGLGLVLSSPAKKRTRRAGV